MTTRTKKTHSRRVTQKLAEAAGKKKLKKQGQLVNEVALVIDASWSMSGWEREVVNTVNEQLGNMRTASAEEDQLTRVTLRLFSSTVDKPVVLSRDVNQVRDWTSRNYRVRANTALNDGIGFTIDDLEALSHAKDDNVSFLLIVITDGQENYSKKYHYNIAERIRKAQSTDRWSVVCLVPPGYRNSTANRLGVPTGN